MLRLFSASEACICKFLPLCFIQRFCICQIFRRIKPSCKLLHVNGIQRLHSLLVLDLRLVNDVFSLNFLLRLVNDVFFLNFSLRLLGFLGFLGLFGFLLSLNLRLLSLCDGVFCQEELVQRIVVLQYLDINTDARELALGVQARLVRHPSGCFLSGNLFTTVFAQLCHILGEIVLSAVFQIILITEQPIHNFLARRLRDVDLGLVDRLFGLRLIDLGHIGRLFGLRLIGLGLVDRLFGLIIVGVLVQHGIAIGETDCTVVFFRHSVIALFFVGVDVLVLLEIAIEEVGRIGVAIEHLSKALVDGIIITVDDIIVIAVDNNIVLLLGHSDL